MLLEVDIEEQDKRTGKAPLITSENDVLYMSTKELELLEQYRRVPPERRSFIHEMLVYITPDKT